MEVAQPNADHWDTDRRSTFLSFWVAAFFAAILSSLFFLALFFRTRRDVKYTLCETTSCRQYGRMLGRSLDRAVSPCGNLYTHVCTGWNRQNKESVLSQRQINHVMTLFRTTRVPKDNQSPIEMASAFFQSCEAVLNGTQDEISVVKSVLKDALIDWPTPSSQPDVLKSITRLHAILNVSILLVVQKKVRENSTVVQIWPGDVIIAALKERIQKALTVFTYREYYLQFSDLFGSPGATDLQRFENFTRVEDSVFHYLGQPQSVHPVELTLETLLRITGARHLKRWEEVFATEMNVDIHEDLASLQVGSVDYLRSFYRLLEEHSERDVHLYVGWTAVQLMAPYASKELAIISYFGDVMAAKKSRPGLCLRHTEAFFGWTVTYHYATHRLDVTESFGVRNIIDRVRLALSTGINRSHWLKPFAENFQPKLDVAHFAGEETDNIEVLFSNMGDLKSGFLSNWLHIVKHFSSRNISLPYAGTGSMPRLVVHESLVPFKISDHTLFVPPYLFSLPLYDADVTDAVNYGSFGSLVAVSVFDVLANMLNANKQTQKQFQERTKCYLEFVGSEGVARLKLSRAVTALTFLWDAFKPEGETRRDVRIPGLHDYTEEQTFFLALCYVLCSRYGSREAETTCNEPLQRNLMFANAFACPWEKGLRARSACSFF